MSSRADAEESDFERVVAALNAERVEFLIVGGFAVVHHGHVRTTEDLDIYIRPTSENADKTVRALSKLGFDGAEITADAFTKDNGLSLGVPPMKVDLIAYVPGVDPEDIWSRRQAGRFGAQKADFISRRDLIANKRAVGRPQDLADVRMLEDGNSA